MAQTYDELRLLRQLERGDQTISDNQPREGLNRLVDEGYVMRRLLNPSQTVHSITAKEPIRRLPRRLGADARGGVHCGALRRGSRAQVARERLPAACCRRTTRINAGVPARSAAAGIVEFAAR
jgi:hypothetical protein